ncbi:ADP/ATP carrier protein, partial [Coelomomyces lativittatus]
MLRGQQRALKSWEVFLVGAISKTLATMVTYPYIMAKTRLQLKPLESSNSKRARATSASEVLLKVYQTDGLKGWYK